MSVRGIALQGFLLTPIAMAVQGLLSGGAIVEPPADDAAPKRAPVVGRGPGTTINYSDYIKQIKGGNAIISNDVQLSKQEQKRKIVKRRQRAEDEMLILLALELE